MKGISTEIEIKATPGKVWSLLTNFSRLAGWNPFIVEAEGNVREGSKLKVRIKLPDRKGMLLKPTVIRAVPDHELRWKGHLLLPGIFMVSIFSRSPP